MNVAVCYLWSVNIGLPYDVTRPQWVNNSKGLIAVDDKKYHEGNKIFNLRLQKGNWKMTNFLNDFINILACCKNKASYV